MSRHSLRKEILRKLFHLMQIPVILLYTIVRHFFSERLAILALTVLFLVLLEIEYIRLEYKIKIPEVIDAFRHRERDHVTSSIFFNAATIIAFAAFDFPLALTALFLTVFGDLTSALVGTKFGKHRIYKKKTFEGFLAGFLMNCLVGYLILPAYPLVFLSMAIVASVVELFTGKLDDNLTVPLFAAFTGQVLIYFLHISIISFPGPLIVSFLRFILPASISF